MPTIRDTEAEVAERAFQLAQGERDRFINKLADTQVQLQAEMARRERAETRFRAAERERDQLKAAKKAMARLAEHLQLSGYDPETVIDNAIGVIERFGVGKLEAERGWKEARAILIPLPIEAPRVDEAGEGL